MMWAVARKTPPSHARAAVLQASHEREFARIAPWLREFYAGYANADKLTALVDCWLFAHRCFLETYGVAATEAFAKAGGSHIRYAWRVDFDVDITFERCRSYETQWTRLAAGVLPRAFLPGGAVRSLGSKLLWRATRHVIASMPIRVREERRSAIVAQMASCFPEYDRPTMESWMLSCVPEAFAADEVRVARKTPLVVDCSSAAFMDFCGYENLLLIDRRLHVVGRQHGGGYDIFRNDPWVRHEQALCDIFVGWGHSAVNERQHKYPRGTGAPSRTAEERRIVIVERPSFARIFEMMSPPIYAQYRNERAIEYTFREIRAANLPYCNLPYPGAMRCPDYDGVRGEEIRPAPGAGGEAALRKSDIVIFDTSAGSLIHYCIEQGILFVVVVSRASAAEFTPAHAEWIGVLRAAGLAFYDDETGALARSLKASRSPAYRPPETVAAYHRRRFIDIN